MDPNVDTEQNERRIILIRETILSYFQDIQPQQSFIFLFDCCLSFQKNEKVDKTKHFSLEAPVQCVVAHATSYGTTASGNGEGGKWTLSLCKHVAANLKSELGEILAMTHDDVMAISGCLQHPQYHSCIGPVHLYKGI